MTLGNGGELCNGLFVVARLEDRAADGEDVGSGPGRVADRRRVNPAVNRQQGSRLHRGGKQSHQESPSSSRNGGRQESYRARERREWHR